MGPHSKKEYMETIYLRYKRATKRAEKSALITELCVTCDWHRKHAIRALKSFKRFTKPKLKKRGKPSVYNLPSVIEPLKRIWLASGQPCSKLLKPTLRLWLPFYAQEFGGLPLNAVKLLLRVSPATIDRIFKSVRIKSDQPPNQEHCCVRVYLSRLISGMRLAPDTLRPIQSPIAAIASKEYRRRFYGLETG